MLRRLLLLTFSLAATLHAGPPVLDAWLKRQESIISLDATFTQERKLPALKNPTITSGRLCFVKPDKVRWQLGDPFETLAVADGKTLTLIDASTQTARRTAVDSPQAARFSLLTGKSFGSPDAFYQSFEVIDSRVSSGIHQFTLKPKDRRIRSQVPWIFLDLDPEKIELRAMEMELQDKSRVKTIFHSPRFNGNIPDSLFQPDLSSYEVK
ncbi:MAG: outer membrane lipoprotein carrier protein LolA [Verrucomicrobiota bacterium]